MGLRVQPDIFNLKKKANLFCALSKVFFAWSVQCHGFLQFELYKSMAIYDKPLFYMAEKNFCNEAHYLWHS